jgi:hypothetical protein
VAASKSIMGFEKRKGNMASTFVARKKKEKEKKGKD